MRVITKTKQFDIDTNNSFASGGEGCIVKIDNSIVAKIYHNTNSAISEQKVKELSVLSDMFVKPLEIIYNNSKPIGYTMSYLEKGEYEPLDTRVCKGVSTKILDQLCKGIEEAHNKNIVIGDLNLLNVMVNSNDDIKFIDVDSYQTASSKHSGVVLQEISDKQRNSEISSESDCFSLAVCCFMLCTKVHPFKGMHKTYKNDFVQRMIHKLPILTGSEPDIKVPKMFVKPNDNLINQFKDIFKNDKRFILKPNGMINTIINTSSLTCSVKHRKINIDKNYKFVTYYSNCIIFNYGDRSDIYNLSVKGFFTLTKIVKHDLNTILIPNNDVIFSFDRKVLINTNSGNKLLEIKEKIINICQNGDILNIVTENLLYTVNLKNMFIKSIPVFGLSFNTNGSLLQTVVNNGSSMSIINGNKIVEKVELSRNKGELTYMLRVNNGKREILLFNGNNKEVTQLDNIPNFEFMMNYYVIPEDGYIQLLNNKLVPLMKIEFSNVSENSNVLFTGAGIVVIENNEVFLLNT